MKFEDRTFSKRLPPLNCAVFVLHEPARALDRHVLPDVPTPYRGTAAAIILPDGRFWVGVTLCSPQDQFVKATGRAKAIGRAYRLFQKRQGTLEDGEVELNNNGEEATKAGEDWTGRLKTFLRDAINDVRQNTVIL